MIDLRDLYVRPGEPVLPAWRRLLEWAKQFRLHAGRGVRLQRTPNGTYVVAEVKAPSWSHPFKVRLSADGAAVGFGTVNGLVPLIDGRPLDGIDSQGVQGEIPALALDGGPGESLRSWVVVDVGADPDDSADSELPLIRHARSLRPETPSAGRHPLAMLLWSPDGGSVLQARQITHFNLRHLELAEPGAGDGSRPSRHLFWAV